MDVRRSWRKRGPAALVGLCVALTLAFILHARPIGLGGAGTDSFFNDWVYNAISMLAAAGCLARGVLVRGDRAAWLAIGLALALSATADIYWTAALAGLDSQPYPSVADALWIASYVPLYAGIVLFIRSRMRHFSAAMWLDGAIGAATMGAVALALLAPAFVGLTEGDTATVATNLAYPLADMILVLVVAGGLTVMHSDRDREWLLIGGAMLLWLVADGLYLYLAATGAYAEGSVMDALWLAAGVLLLAAAWRRPHSGDVHPSPKYESLALPGLYAALAVGMLAYDLWEPLNRGAAAFAVVAVGLGALRLVLSHLENRTLLARVQDQAVTDSLTGLPNRRKLMEDLDAALDRGRGRDERRRIFALYDLNGFKLYNDAFGHSAGDELLTRLGKKLQGAIAPHGTAYRLGGDEFCVLAAADREREQELAAAAAAALSESGAGFEISCSGGVIVLPDEADESSLAMRLADDRMYAHKSSRALAPARQTRDVLLSTLREREPSLARHLNYVAKLAREMGRALGLDSDDLDELVRAAELHDVGKVAIPDSILHKPGLHDDTEREWMQQHTVIGERILNSASAMAGVARIVRSSHERWDGSGYPDGLREEEIPLGSRIVFICDAYDAMISGRGYGVVRSKLEAIVELRDHAGTQFDPSLVRIFIRLVATEDEAPTEIDYQRLSSKR